MKKILLTLLLLLSLGLAASAQQTETQWSATFKKGANNSQSAFTTKSETSDVFSEGAEYFSAITDASNVSPGMYGLKIGTSKKTGYITLSLAEKAQVIPTSIELEVSANKTPTQLDFKVNGVEHKLSNSASINDTYETITIKDFTEPLTTLKLEGGKNGFIFVNRITVHYQTDKTIISLDWTPAETSILKGETLSEIPTLSISDTAAESAIEYSSSDESVLKCVDGKIQLVNSDKIGIYTVTASIPADNETFSATPAVFKLYISTKDKWTLVSDASSLAAGDRIIIATAEYNKAMATEESTNNRKATDVTIANGVLSFTTEPLIIELGGQTGAWTLKSTNYAGTNGFLTCDDVKNNYLKIDAAQTDATISIAADGNADIKFNKGTRNKIRYNSSSTLFSCYDSVQDSVQIYKFIPSPVITATINGKKIDDIEEVDYGTVVKFTVEHCNNDDIYATANGEDITFTDCTCEYIIKEDAVIVIMAGDEIAEYDFIVNPTEVLGLQYDVKSKKQQIDVEYHVYIKNHKEGEDSYKVMLTIDNNAPVDIAAGSSVIEIPAAENAPMRTVGSTGATDGATHKLSGTHTRRFDVTDTKHTVKLAVYHNDSATPVHETEIINKTTTGIEDVTVDGADAPAEYYTPQGVRVATPEAGQIYIVRRGARITKELSK